MDNSVIIPLKSLEAMLETLLEGSKSPTNAAWACGAVYVGITNAIMKGVMKDENRNGV